MKTHSQSRCKTAPTLLLLLAGASHLHAQTDTTRRFSVGALLNLDAGGIPPGNLSADKVPLELSDAELSLGMHLRPDLDAQVVFVHEEGISTVEQAFATWKSPAADLVFGKTRLPLGLYPGRLVHDPSLQKDVETIVPSVTTTRDLGPLGLHLSGSQLAHRTDSGETEFPALVAAADLTWNGSGLARISTKVAHRVRTMDAAAQIPMGPVVLDLEGVVSDGAWADSGLAGLFGLSWRPRDTVLLAARLDARRERESGDWSRSAAAGATVRFAEFAYAAAEWLQDLDGDGALTLRLGMEI